MLLGLKYLLDHLRLDFLTPLPFFTLCAEHLDILTLDCSYRLAALKTRYEKVWTDIVFPINIRHSVLSSDGKQWATICQTAQTHARITNLKK